MLERRLRKFGFYDLEILEPHQQINRLYDPSTIIDTPNT